LETHKDVKVTKEGKSLRYTVVDAKETTTLWVDTATQLPVRMVVEVERLCEGIARLRIEFSDFEWDPELKGFKSLDDLFSLSPPEGYRLDDQTKKPAEEKKDKEPGKGPAENQDAVKVVKPGAKSVRSLAYCNDGKRVALVLWNGRDFREGGSVVLWDVQTEKVQHTLEECDNIGARLFSNVTSSKDGTTIAVASSQLGKPKDGAWHGAIKVWDAQTGKLVKPFELDGRAGAVALSADGAKVIGGACGYPRTNGKLFVWDVKRGEVVQTLEVEGMLYSAAAISDDGQWIAGAGDLGDPTYKGKVVVWQVETGKVKHEWAGLPPVSAVAFSPDGKQVAAAAPGAAAGPDDKVIRVWDMQTGKLKHQLKPEGGHTISGL